MITYFSSCKSFSPISKNQRSLTSSQKVSSTPSNSMESQSMCESNRILMNFTTSSVSKSRIWFQRTKKTFSRKSLVGQSVMRQSHWRQIFLTWAKETRISMQSHLISRTERRFRKLSISTLNQMCLKAITSITVSNMTRRSVHREEVILRIFRE